MPSTSLPRILHPQENPAKKLPSFDHASRLSFCVSRRSESEKNKKITEWDPQEAEKERQARQGEARQHAVISPRRSDLPFKKKKRGGQTFNY
jgi:hypothetical protein